MLPKKGNLVDLLSAINADQSDAAAPAKKDGPVIDLLGSITAGGVTGRKWLPHLNGQGNTNPKTGEKYDDVPTELQGEVLERSQVDNYDGDGKVEQVVVKNAADGQVYRIVGDHKVLNDEILRTDPQRKDLFAVKHLGSKPNAKNPRRKPTQMYGAAVAKGYFA